MTNSVMRKRRDFLVTLGATQEHLSERNRPWHVAIDPFVLAKLPMFVCPKIARGKFTVRTFNTYQSYSMDHPLCSRSAVE